MNKRFFSLLICLCLMFALLPITTLAADDYDGDISNTGLDISITRPNVQTVY